MTQRKVWKYEVRREGQWWLIAVPELGLVTQARHLGESEAMATSIIALHLGRAAGGVRVGLTTPIEVSEQATALLREADDFGRLGNVASCVKAEAAWWLVRKEGLTQRDAGHLLGISHQRVAQLVADAAGSGGARQAKGGAGALRERDGARGLLAALRSWEGSPEDLGERHRLLDAFRAFESGGSAGAG